jgi:lysophospholipase L1-like esterase
MFLELPRKKLDPGLFEYCMQQISKTLKGSKAVFIDITENVKKAGWGNLFYDGIHPNISGNSVIADEAARVIMAGR